MSSAAVFSEREHTTDNADDDEDDDGTMTATKHQRSVCIGAQSASAEILDGATRFDAVASLAHQRSGNR